MKCFLKFISGHTSLHVERRMFELNSVMKTIYVLIAKIVQLSYSLSLGINFMEVYAIPELLYLLSF